MNRLEEIRKAWTYSNTITSSGAKMEEISSFQRRYGLLLPRELVNYFIELNGTSDKYEDRFFRFYSLTEFKSVKDELGKWESAPDYRNIVNTLENHENCFVFSDYQCNLFTYAIRLSNSQTEVNEVYIICGDRYEVIAESFSEFLNLYINDSAVLYL